MKLIDVLNMISKGELEEGFQIKFDEKIYTYRLANENEIFRDFYEEGENDDTQGVFASFFISAIINDEVEVISPKLRRDSNEI